MFNKNNFNWILNKIKLFQNKLNKKILLVSVSKTKTNECILEAYNNDVRDFGENYIDELIEKHNSLPKDINWHFIGHLQSNKVSKLMNLNIKTIQSVDSEKILKKINKQALLKDKIQDIYIQIKMSDEISKFGIDKKDLDSLVKFCLNDCKNVNLEGFMMISKIGDIESFKVFNNWRNDLNKEYNKNFKISMGMSDDFEEALNYNTDVVRIGSLIFGKREY